MSNPLSGHNLSYFHEEKEKIVIATSKQYLAVADDFLRRLFPELTPDRVPYPGSFTVFITDGERVYH